MLKLSLVHEQCKLNIKLMTLFLLPVFHQESREKQGKTDNLVTFENVI